MSLIIKSVNFLNIFEFVLLWIVILFMLLIFIVFLHCFIHKRRKRKLSFINYNNMDKMKEDTLNIDTDTIFECEKEIFLDT